MMIPEEQERLARARDGDHAAFKEIVDKHKAQVAATVIGILGYCAEVDDIGQETFVQFYRSLHRFRGDSSIGTYLTRIAINLSLNELKRRGRRDKVFCSSFRDDLEIPEVYEDRQAANEIKDMVRRGIDMLEPELKTLIVLRLINGFTTQETAGILRLPVGTVLSRLARAQAKLRDILRETHDFNSIGGENDG